MAQLTIQQAFELAVQHHQSGRLQEAESIYRQILALQPEHAGVLHYLGMMTHQLGQNDTALDLLRRARALAPDMPVAHSNLGTVLEATGHLDEAIAAYRHAIALLPNYPEAQNNLGHALQTKGHLDEAIAACRKAIALRPSYPEAHNNLAVALQAQGRLDEAIAALRQAIVLQPDYSDAHNNLGNALKDKGHMDESIAAYRQAIALKPDDPEAHSNLIYSLHYHPGFDAAAIAQECSRWNQQHAEPLKGFVRPHANGREADRRLRIGYVSPDFREHVVARFLSPLLEQHDKTQVEVSAYAQVLLPDAMTQRLRSHTDHWRTITGLGDQQVAEQIRQDRIDILVDLALHTAHNRLLVFARKPAPVQVTYLAYAGSSGLSTMDYRLSDPYLDPPDARGGDELVYKEPTIRLPQTYWCYQSVVDMPLQPPPALEKRFVTFGCLNNFSKVNEPLLSLWARILRGVPHSRLLLHTLEGSHRQRVLAHLQREGIEPQRVNFAAKVSMAAYFNLYQSIDIALDTLPYAGGTTTCDALWMGVPVVSLKGKTAVGRAGLSILSNVGLPELVAETSEQYVRLALDLANDLPRLKELRGTLRQRMQASPLMDAPKFARNVETAYRQMWRNWCATAG